MKKTLLAAALMTGFAGIAQAETSVTLYGLIDTGVGYERIKHSGGAKTTRFGINEGTSNANLGSRWGLKGSEDLGNGLRANFVLESGFDVRTGNSLQNDRLFGRQATLGLSGDSWGRIDFGRQTTIGSRYFVDVHGQAWGNTGSNTAFDAQDANRMDNSVVYETPNYSGFQFGIGYSFQSDGDQIAKASGVKNQNDSAFTTGLKYANGPIDVALTYDSFRRNASGVVPGTSYKHTDAWTLSGSYDFDVVAVSLAFGQEFDGKITSGLYNKKHNYNNYNVGLAFPLGEGSLSGAYTLSQPRKDAKKVAGEKKSHNFSVAYVHPLSKRTDVYASAGYNKNYLNVDGDKRTVAGVGLTHRF